MKILMTVSTLLICLYSLGHYGEERCAKLGNSPHECARLSK